MRKKEAANPSLANFSNSTGSLFGFLITELLFFVMMGIDKDAQVVTFLGLILLVFAVVNVFTVTKYNNNEQATLLLGSGLLLIFGLLGALGAVFDNRSFLGFVLVAFGFITFFLLGFLINGLDGGNIKIVMHGIFIGLGLLVLITLLVNMYNYSFFYLIRYKGYVFYYDGLPVQISNQVKFLLGLDFVFANQSVAGFYNILLASVLLPTLLFFKDFKQKDTKWLYLGLGILGVISLAFYPNVRALILFAPLIGALLVIRFYDSQKKWLKPTLYVLLGLFAIFLLFAFFWAFDVVDIFKHIPLLRRIFGSGTLGRWKDVLKKATWFGYNWWGIYEQQATGNLLLDVLYQFGILAFIVLIIFIAFSGYQVYRYYKNSGDSKLVKFIIISYLLTLFVISFFDYPYHPLIEIGGEIRSINHNPILTNGAFMVAMALIGYTISAQFKLEEALVLSEEMIENESEVITHEKSE